MQRTAMLTDELNKLIECIQLQVNRKTIAFSDIEHTASSLIINDEFDSLPDDVQSELFFLDNCEFEKPSASQLAASINVFKKYLSKGLK